MTRLRWRAVTAEASLARSTWRRRSRRRGPPCACRASGRSTRMRASRPRWATTSSSSRPTRCVTGLLARPGTQPDHLLLVCSRRFSCRRTRRRLPSQRRTRRRPCGPSHLSDTRQGTSSFLDAVHLQIARDGRQPAPPRLAARDRPTSSSARLGRSRLLDAQAALHLVKHSDPPDAQARRVEHWRGDSRPCRSRSRAQRARAR